MFRTATRHGGFDERHIPFLIGGFSAFIFIDGVVTGVGMVLLWQILH